MTQLLLPSVAGDFVDGLQVRSLYDGDGEDNALGSETNRAAHVAVFLRSLPSDDVNFSLLRFWRQWKPAAVNLTFFDLEWKQLVPSKRKRTSPALYNKNNHEQSQNTYQAKTEVIFDCDIFVAAAVVAS